MKKSIEEDEDMKFEVIKYADGRVEIIGDWKKQIAISYELLVMADQSLIQFDGKELIISLANGTARYTKIDIYGDDAVLFSLEEVVR